MKWIFILSLLFSHGAFADGAFKAENYKGKVVYLDFWASWCGPCKESFPWLNQLQQKYKDKGLVIVGINLDKEKAKAESFLKDHPAQFEIIFNGEGTLAKQYGVKGMPYSVILGKNGEVLHSHIGFHSDKTAEYIKTIEGALK